MEAIIFCIVLYYAVRAAHEHTKAAFKASREAYADRAAKAHPGMPRGQQVRSALRHDAGFAAAQLRHGFPSARHGFAQGWHEARTAHAEAHAGREKAKAERAESLADLIEEVRQYRERQAVAAERARASAAGGISEGSGEGTPEGSTSPGPEKVIPGTAEDVDPGGPAWDGTGIASPDDEPDSGRYLLTVRSKSGRVMNPVTGSPVETIAVWSREDLERRLAAAAGDPDLEVEHRPMPDDDWDAPLPGEEDDDPVSGNWERDPHEDDQCAICGTPLVDEPGHVCVHCQEGRRPPDCWLCGLPVSGDELGASAHQRCAEVNDRDMERTEVADGRDLDEVERDLREQGKCPYQTAYGHGGTPRYCGQPIDGDEDEFCPQHQAEDEGDYDRATAEVHRRTRELLQQDQAQQSANPQNTGGTQMSDVTYDGVVRDMNAEVASAESRAAEVNAAKVAAEAQSQEAASAKAKALTISEGMQALDMDPATLGAIADHIDAADAADKAHQEAEEALGRAHAATVRVTETAQNVQATMAQGHSGLAAAHQEAPVQAATREFYQD